MISDAVAVDAALIALLDDDPTLAALLPHGWFVDVAGTKNATQFGIVSLVDHEDTYQFGAVAYERGVYMVKAVLLTTQSTRAAAAAARIQALLQHAQPTIAGYGVLTIRRRGRIRYTEVDPESDSRWQHQGGEYEVMVSPQ